MPWMKQVDAIAETVRLGDGVGRELEASGDLGDPTSTGQRLTPWIEILKTLQQERRRVVA